MKICEICEKEVSKVSKLSPITCQKCYDKERYQKNKDRECEKSRNYYINNKSTKKQYYQDNKEKILDYYKRYRAENINKLKKLDNDYYLKHREEILIKRKDYYIENREEISGRRHNRNYIQPKKRCSICGLIKVANTRDGNGNVICKSCYVPIKRKCDLCGGIKVIYKRSDEHGSLCLKCYRKILYYNDECFRVKTLLRSRLRGAFLSYSKHGKVRASKDYGIDWIKIFEHIGARPTTIRNEYHIDHIIPLSMFDFNNELHIKAAFAPENHRWLLKKENLSKGNKCSIEEFEKYMEKFYEGISQRK